MVTRRKKNGEYVMPERDKRMRGFDCFRMLPYVNKGISINLLCTMITSLIGAQNPHVPCVHSGFSGSVRLVLKALATIYRGAHK